jgi:uncharacterized C2H2 Zn-finger protein
MHQVSVFQCDHCKRINSSQRNMRRHENKCHFNPANRSCAMCVHLQTVDFDYDVYLGDGEVDSRSRPGPWCAAKEMQLNPLQTKCSSWAALPTGGASAYFAQQPRYAIQSS